MGFINKNAIKNLSAEKRCHMYALIAWNGYDFNQAFDTVLNTSEKELDSMTYASSSINSAIEGIDKYKDELSSRDKYNAIVAIVIKIHDNWVVNNAKKYDRDKEKNDKRLFQHLPAAMIGLDELAKDMMFLEPFLYDMGIKIGEMTDSSYGAFIPSEDIYNAYRDYVDAFMSRLSHDMVFHGDNKEIIDYAINNYKPLHKNDTEVDQNRIAYMKDREDILVDQVKKVMSSQNYICYKNENAETM